jgi:hypothetical protein
MRDLVITATETTTALAASCVLMTNMTMLCHPVSYREAHSRGAISTHHVRN